MYAQNLKPGNVFNDSVNPFSLRPDQHAPEQIAPASPEGVPLTPPELPQKDGAPDLDQISFNDLKFENTKSIPITPELEQALKREGPITWNTGDAASDVLTLEDAKEFKVADLTLAEAHDRSKGKEGIDFKTVGINTARIVSAQSIDGIVDTVPGLGDLPLGKVSPIFKVVDNAAKSYAKGVLIPLVDKKIKDILGANPAIGELRLDSILNPGNIADIPGLQDVPLNQFPGYQRFTIAEAGLGNVPLNKLPVPLGNLSLAPIGIVDVVWGPQESQSTHKPITGSNVVGFKVPCKQRNCAYLELRDPAGKKGPLHGARWIKGGKPEKGGQMVPGGSGAVGKALGGKEPTGRMPFGGQSKIKLVISDTDEATGTSELSIYLGGYCYGAAGCAPYIFGPIKFATIHEGDPLLVGFDPASGKAKAPEPNVKIPDQIKDQIQQLDEQFGSSSDTGESGDQCLKKISDKLPPEKLGNTSSLPHILKEAEKAKLTPSQTAYVVASAFQDGSLVEVNEWGNLIASNTYGDYYPRGLASLTGEPAYQKLSKLIGVDLVRDPGKADDPEVSAKVLVLGMKHGAFTGKRLDSYINQSQVDYVGARQILGGNDDAQDIANHASQYQEIMKKCAAFGGSCAGEGTKMIKPSQGPITSTFGGRIHPISGVYSTHAGVDIGSPFGSPVLSADCGKVVRAQWEGGYGNSVVVEHKGKRFTRYGHLSKINVPVGSPVNRGQKVGQVGSTGNSTGPHLHFEVIPGSPDNYRDDPRKYAALY
ncbi:M23 family metallopeptidase (plasmid) [Acaryochloris sp. CCMEE 5410]|nr:M23 family metallopeptidase [Acaryochloris sp. CCMEE 5410]